MRSHPRTRNRSRHFTTGLAAAATSALLVLAGCTPTSESPESSSDADLSSYLEQELDWAGCKDTATNAADAKLFANRALECASVKVPLDYDDPKGETANVALLRLPATGKGEAEGSLLINTGGPGGSGTNFVASSLPLWQDNPVAERFDIVGFDPRGIGSSTPAFECYTDKEYDAGDVPRFGAVYDVTSAKQASELAERCTDGSGGVENLVNAGSANVVQDMDIMREALGDEKLSYLGYSYGSELGAMYASSYPDKVRALVLDGAVAPDLTARDFRLSAFAGLQARFDDLAALCAESSDCVLGTDPKAANDRLRKIVQTLIETPVPAADGREVSVWDAYLGISAGLFAETKWPDIISALTDLEAGQADKILALRDAFYGRTAEGFHSIDLDTNIAVRCMDWPRLTPKEQTALARKVGEVAPMFDLDVFTAGNFHSECEAWPAPPTRDEPWLDPDVEGLPETLVVSVTGDPATPHTGGIAMADALDGSLLTVEGKQHGAYLLGGSECVDDAVNTYLLDLETPATNARCSL